MRKPFVAMQSWSLPGPAKLRVDIQEGLPPAAIHLAVEVFQNLHDLSPSLVMKMRDRLPHATLNVGHHAAAVWQARIAHYGNDPRQPRHRLATLGQTG